jgi:hypothetical protein
MKIKQKYSRILEFGILFASSNVNHTQNGNFYDHKYSSFPLQTDISFSL